MARAAAGALGGGGPGQADVAAGHNLLADPIRYVDELAKLSGPDRAKIMSGNLVRLVAD
jgi:hypothetical protein